MYAKYLELLREMVRIPSPSYEEEAVGCLIGRFLDDAGIAYQTHRGNIISVNRHFDPALKTLALDAHIDTVKPNNGYTRDPYDPGNDDNIIYGLGSNDDGGSVVSMMAAYMEFYEKRLAVNLMLILSREEECSGADGTKWLFGSDGLFASGAGGYNKPDWVIVGEPTGMRAATSERGLLVIDGVTRGISGHAARSDGDNAIYKAMEDIEKLRNHKFGRLSPAMGEVKLNVTEIQAGQGHNVIPDLCRFTVDIRPTEQYTNEEIMKELQAVCKSELRARNLTNRSSATPSESLLWRTAEELGMEFFSSPTTSDWMRIDSEAIKMGPGDSVRSHRADEYILTAEIREAIEKYIKFIERFNGNVME